MMLIKLTEVMSHADPKSCPGNEIDTREKLEKIVEASTRESSAVRVKM